MATKILLATSNSQWGYGTTSALSFDTPQLRDWFLNKELFNGENYKDLIQQTPDRAFPVIDSDTMTFKIGKFEYENETTMSLLEKTYAIMLNEGVYTYWFIRGRAETKNIIAFDCKRDWLTERGIENIFKKDIKVNITQAHTYDLEYDEEGNETGLWNNQMDGDNIFVEGIEDFPDSNYFPTKIEECEVDYRSDITSDDKEDGNKALNQGWWLYQLIPSWTVVQDIARAPIGWGIRFDIPQQQATDWLPKHVYYQFRGEMFATWATDLTLVTQPIQLPYINLMLNERTVFVRNLETDNFLSLVTQDFRGLRTLLAQQESKQLKKTLPLLPKGTCAYSINNARIQIAGITLDIYKTIDVAEWEGNNWGEGKTTEIDSFKYVQTRNWINEFQEWEINKADYDKTSDEYVPSNIAKIHQFPFERISLKTINGTQKTIMQQLIKNKMTISYKYSGAIDASHIMYKINDKDNAEGIYNTNYKYGQWLDDNENWEMPLANDPYNDYLRENRNQLQVQQRKYRQDMLFSALSLGQLPVSMSNTASNTATKNFASALDVDATNNANRNNWIKGEQNQSIYRDYPDGGSNSSHSAMRFNTGNPFGTILSATKGIIDAQNNMRMQSALLLDKMGASRDIKSNSDDTTGVLTMTNIMPLMIKEELQPSIKSMLAYYFHQFGVQLGNQPRDPKLYLNNKKHFNFFKGIQIGDTLDPSLPYSARESLIELLEDGVWVWHVRDENFKGIKNFEVNNIDWRTT